MSFIPDINDSNPHTRFREPDAEQARAVKKWTAELLALNGDAVVTVSELDCNDPSCPIIETVIAVHESGRPRRFWSFARPKAAITKLMLAQAFASATGQLPSSPSQ